MNSSKESSRLDMCYDPSLESRPVNLTSEVSASLISLSAMSLLLSPCSIILNILVMIAVKTTPRLRNNCNILLASLAGTDLIVGAISQPLFAIDLMYRVTGNLEHQTVCILQYIRDTSARWSVPASAQHLALLSIERYLVIKYPYRYQEIITKPRLTSSLVFAWSVAAILVVLAAIPTVNNNFNFFPGNYILIASILILIFCQIAVYHEASNQMNKIKTQQMSLERKENFLREKKALITTTIVIGTVLLTNVPLIAFRLVFEPLSISPGIKFLLESVARSLILCNSVCNPLIYCTRSSEYRRVFKRILLRQNQENTTESDNSSSTQARHHNC